MSKILPTYNFEVGNGVVMPKLDSFRHTLKNLAPGKYALIVKPVKPSRSLNQNRLFWMWCTVIGDEIGYEPDEVKLLLQEKFLREPLQDGTMVTKGTSSLNTKEFTEFLDKVDRWSLEFHNITLPTPEFLGLLDE